VKKLDSLKQLVRMTEATYHTTNTAKIKKGDIA